MEDIQVCSINTRFIFIQWYENKYLSRVKYDNFHTEIKNNLLFIEKKLEFLFIILLSVI